jgi:UPF0271 protein
MFVNINSDMGESYGRWQLGNDAELMELVPTVNIACGFHAGDPQVMRHTVALAAERGREVGAHVALPDVLGFGRRRMDIASSELRDCVLYQIGALHAFAAAAGVRISHVKPHGSLYAMCGQNKAYAEALLGAVAEFDAELIVIQGGAAAQAAAPPGMLVVPEGYIDLAYQSDGYPVVERVKIAWDPEEVAARALRIVQQKRLESVDGTPVEVDVPTICVHGDAPNSLEVAKRLLKALQEASVEVLSLRSAVLRFRSDAARPARV